MNAITPLGALQGNAQEAWSTAHRISLASLSTSLVVPASPRPLPQGP